MHRYATAFVLVLLCVFLLVTGSAQAIGLVNVPSTHAQATLNVLNNRPNLTSLVLGVWPDFYVNGCYGGMAWPGWIDVNVHLWGVSYTDQVAHEWGHEVMRAADTKGLNLSGKWTAFMRSKGWNPSVVEASHAFTENLSQAYWYPYYAKAADTPYRVSKSEMQMFLADAGVTP
jgi:hypothetical protein